MSHPFLRFPAVLAMAIALAGCGRSESYRYKLTLAVDTPTGVKRASSVAQVLFWDVSIPARGTMHKLRGQALYLDLGPGARPLIALLTSHRPSPCVTCPGNIRTLDGGPSLRLISRVYGIAQSTDYRDDIPRIARLRGPHRITPNDLPDLVTFEDINNPSTVIEVDPNNLQATLGPDVSWNELTLESTDEPITKGIELKLPWIPAYWCGMLDGRRYHDKATLANTLSTADFDWSDEARERINQKLRGNIELECWKSRTAWAQRHQ